MSKKSLLCSLLAIGLVAVGLKVYAAYMHPIVFYSYLKDCTPYEGRNYFGHKYIIDGVKDGKCVVREEGDLRIICNLTKPQVNDLVQASNIYHKTVITKTFPNGLTVTDQHPTAALWNYYMSDTSVCRINTGDEY